MTLVDLPSNYLLMRLPDNDPAEERYFCLAPDGDSTETRTLYVGTLAGMTSYQANLSAAPTAEGQTVVCRQAGFRYLQTGTGFWVPPYVVDYEGEGQTGLVDCRSNDFRVSIGRSMTLMPKPRRFMVPLLDELRRYFGEIISLWKESDYRTPYQAEILEQLDMESAYQMAIAVLDLPVLGAPCVDLPAACFSVYAEWILAFCEAGGPEVRNLQQRQQLQENFLAYCAQITAFAAEVPVHG